VKCLEKRCGKIPLSGKQRGEGQARKGYGKETPLFPLCLATPKNVPSGGVSKKGTKKPGGNGVSETRGRNLLLESSRGPRVWPPLDSSSFPKGFQEENPVF